MTLRGKTTYFGSSNRIIIDGKHYSVQSFIMMAKDKGVELTPQMITRRVKAGVTTLEGMIAPNKRLTEHKNRYIRKKAEMAEVLAQMGPPRRY